MRKTPIPAPIQCTNVFVTRDLSPTNHVDHSSPTPSHLPHTRNSMNNRSHNPIKKRSTDRNTLTKKRRSAPKIVDPLEILTLVVAGPRQNGKFFCPLCSSNFGRRCELKRHIAEVHTINGARRFLCKHPACGKSFTRKDTLAKHQVVKHQGKRRFVCPTCSEKFTSRYDLSRHNIRVHSNVKKRFTCEFCSAGFSQKSQLTMHKGRVHSPPNNNSISPSQRSSMDSLAAAAVAIAAAEEAAELKRQTQKQVETECVRRCIELRCKEESTCKVIEEKTLQESVAETLAAEALLEAAGVIELGRKERE